MVYQSPTWLDASYVQRILRNSEKDETITVSDITVRPAIAKGENFGSDMHRVAVEFLQSQNGNEIQERKSLIVKVSPEGLMGEVVENVGFFRTELSMMSITLPKMNEMLQRFSSAPLNSRHFYVQYEKPTHIVIEDLAPEGFRMAERQAGLDLDHSILTLKNLGRFHAASVALKEQDAEAFTNYKKWTFHKNPLPMWETCYKVGTKTLAEAAANWPELDPRIPEKLFKLSEVIYEKGCEVAVFRENDFNVLNHGDFKVNNMMFRYDEQQRPIDHIFVDFQLAYYGSPAIDLLYFIGTSPTDDVRHHNRELLLQEYYTSLTNTMNKLKCKTVAPSFDELKETLKQKALCEVIVAITIMPGLVIEKGVEWNVDDVLNTDKEYKNPSYSGKLYRTIMTRLLPWYDSMGLLDV